MVHTSANQKIKILVVYLLWGIGIGAILSMILSLSKLLPDTFMSMLAVVLPVTCVYVVLRMVRSFNQICIDADKITIVSVVGKKTEYPRDEFVFSLAIKGYTAYGTKYAPLLYINILHSQAQKQKNYILAPYNEVQISQIADMLDIADSV